VPQIVPAKINDLSLTDALLEPTLPIASFPLIGTGANVRRLVAILGQRLESLFRYGVDWHVARGPVLGLWDSDDPGPQIQVLPA